MFPGNTITLISILIPVVGFDILENVLDWEWFNQLVNLFDFEEHELVGEKIFAQITDIGYETFNTLMILNTLGVVLIFYLIKVLVWLILKGV